MNSDAVVNLQDKRILVSGGTRGMGAAAAQVMTGFGADVLVTARTVPDVGDRRSVAVDAALPGAARIIADAVMRELGGVDAIVHCVGASFDKPGGALALSDDDWDASLSTNLL